MISLVVEDKIVQNNNIFGLTDWQRHICRQINHSDGIFNIQTIAEEVELERRLLKDVTVALTEAKTAENSEKIWHVVRSSILLGLA